MLVWREWVYENKSGVWYWLAVASGAVGMLYALGFAGSIEALGVISDTDFITAMVLLLLALFFARLGDHAARARSAAPQAHRPPPRPHRRAGVPAEPEGRMKTKRMKKLLMGMGLSRNQVNHMSRAAVERLFQNQQWQPITTLSTGVFPSHAGVTGWPYIKSLVLE